MNKTNVNSNANPLVSVIVITYNSTIHVLETLESISAQTYDNIELVITDDASEDDTLIKCRRWVEKNATRFCNIVVIQSSVNLGISANCNKGLKAANGEWIKLFAADDVLFKDAIEVNMEFVLNAKEPIQILYSESLYYQDKFDENRKLKGEIFGNQLMAAKNVTAKIQYQILLRGCHVNTPTVFINKSVFKTVGYFDEQFTNIEDWPMWIRIADAGIKFYFLNRPTVRYRVHNTSVSNHRNNGKLFKELSLTEWPIYQKLVINNVSRFEKFLIIALEKRKRILIAAGFNKNNFLARFIDYASFWPFKNLQLLAEKKIFKKLKKKLNN